jgi:endoglucanase
MHVPASLSSLAYSRSLKLLFLSVLCLALPLALMSCQQQAVYQQHAALQASPTITSTQITQHAFFRGLNLMGPWQSLWGDVNVFASPQQLDYYRAKGLTTIRQPLLWEALQPVKFGPLDATYLRMIDTFVANLKARGMQVSFTFINQGVYPARSTNVIMGSDLADVWAKLAAHYKNEPTVWAYDLMNEPYNDTDWLAHAQQSINVIRSVDPAKPIIVMPQDEGPTGYSTFTGYTDPDNNLWYQVHVYFDHDNSGNYTGTYDQEEAYPTIGIDRIAPFVDWCQSHATVSGQVRCLVGEYGIPGGWSYGDTKTTYGSATTDPRWLTVLDTFLTYLDQNGMSATYWEAGPYGDSDSVEPDHLGAQRSQMAILEKHLGMRNCHYTTATPYAFPHHTPYTYCIPTTH